MRIALQQIKYFRARGYGRRDIMNACGMKLKPTLSWDDLAWTLADIWEALPKMREAA